MNILLLDLESTGVDTKKDRIIEIGAMLVDETWKKQSMFSTLVKGHDYPPLSADIQRITKIDPESLSKDGVDIEEAMRMLSAYVSIGVDYVVAFNRSFDESLFKEEVGRGGYSMFPGINQMIQVPWVCSMVDIEDNYMYKSWKLSHLALEYGVVVDPKKLHRAINDVELMRELLIASKSTIDRMHEFQQIPWTFVAALIPAPWIDNGVGKNAAVKAGYSWEIAKGTDGPKWDKTWVKRIKKHKLEVEEKSVPFKIREIRDGKSN